LAPVRDDDLAGRERAVDDPSAGAPGDAPSTAADPVLDEQSTCDGAVPSSRGWRARSLRIRLPRLAPLWISVFAASLGLFLIRFLVPTPVAQADNRDGPRLMCGLGVGPVLHGHPRFFRFAYFDYVHWASCNGRAPYPSSELVPLVVAKLLTPVFGLPGSLNLIALGVLMCALASVGIASLATGLRIKLWARLLVAAVAWLIMADAAFFDVYAGPFSEPAALIGLLLVAAGAVYLGRSWRDTVVGLVLAGSGGFLAILSKEQYLILAAPICLTLVLACAGPGRWYSLGRLWTRQGRAALAVAGLLAFMTAVYIGWDFTSHYGQRLHHVQAVDMIFTDIVTNRATAPAQLRALGLPVSWARYAGHYYWDKGSVRTNPRLPHYYAELGDANIAHYLLTHPVSIVRIGQQAAEQAQLLRVTALGTYLPSAGHPPGAYESRVIVFTWLMHQLPRHVGLWFYLPVWVAMAAVAIAALLLRRRRAWHRDGAVLVLCMACSAAGMFIPPAYFAGISTTRHMVGTNLATLLAILIGLSLAVSMIHQALARERRPDAVAAPAVPASAPDPQHAAGRS
jgi:hypothetical protein